MATLVPSSIASSEIVPSNQQRAFVAVENTDANTLYLLIGGGAASATNFTVSLASGDYYEVPRVVVGFPISGVWSADGSGGAMVTTI